MASTIELTVRRRAKIRQIRRRALLFAKLLAELSDERVFRLYAAGKNAIARKTQGVTAGLS